MADYAHKAATTGSIYLETVAEYDLYCHYVAGLVGEGLSRIFSASKKEVSWLGDQLELSNSMGLLLQKTNIIRDYREDVDQQRYFWPREIWGRKEYGFSEMKEMYAEGAEERAMWAQSGMVLDALRHATDALDYLRILKNQSVFNFCAIPATMAIATLELCYMNPTMFQRNVKIRKAEAAKVRAIVLRSHSSAYFLLQLIMRSTNPREVSIIFQEYTRKIHAKSVPSDPNFLKISVACGKVCSPFLAPNLFPHIIHLDRAMVRTLLPIIRPNYGGDRGGNQARAGFLRPTDPHRAPPTDAGHGARAAETRQGTPG